MRKAIKLALERPLKKEIYINVDAIQKVERKLMEVGGTEYHHILRLIDGKDYYISEYDYLCVLWCFDIINA